MPSYTVVFPDRLRVVQRSYESKGAEPITTNFDYVFSAAIPASFLKDCVIAELRRKQAAELRELGISRARELSEKITPVDVYRKYVKRVESPEEMLAAVESSLSQTSDKEAMKAKLQDMLKKLESLEEEEEK